MVWDWLVLGQVVEVNGTRVVDVGAGGGGEWWR